MTKIAVIGGGIAGVSAALELAERGHSVRLIEEAPSLLTRSSDATPCRLGLGFHYIDEATAIRYLRNTIKFVRQYRDLKFPLRVGEDKPMDHPLRRGRYFITKDSLFSREEILAVYEKLKEEYRRLVEEDSENEVFGPVDNFYRILREDEYRDEVNTEIVEVGIETAEHILNWPLFKDWLIQQVIEHPNIELHLNTRVLKVKKADASSDDDSLFNYTVHAREPDDSVVEYPSSYIINSAWQEIGAITQSAALSGDAFTHRVKVIVEVALPEVLHTANSMFFCFGPHAAFTNTGNGKGWVSYEPVTNIGSSSDLLLPDDLARLVHGDSSLEEHQAFGRAIVAGASRYIPSLAGAVCSRVKIGVVKTHGSEASITSKIGAIHSRNSLGIETPMPGWINNPCMKLLYFVENREVVSNLIEFNMAIRRMITEILEDSAFALFVPMNKTDKVFTEVHDAAGSSLASTFSEKESVVETDHHSSGATSREETACARSSRSSFCEEDEGLHEVSFEREDTQAYSQFKKTVKDFLQWRLSVEYDEKNTAIRRIGEEKNSFFGLMNTGDKERTGIIRSLRDKSAIMEQLKKSGHERESSSASFPKKH